MRAGQIHMLYTLFKRMHKPNVVYLTIAALFVLSIPLFVTSIRFGTSKYSVYNLVSGSPTASLMSPHDLCWYRPQHVEYIWNAINEDGIACSFTTIGIGDGSKNLCELPSSGQPVVSFGSANDWTFESQISNWTRNIYTFDCTSDDRGKPPFVTFNKKCIGEQHGYGYEQMCREMNICNDAVLKMDIEWGEWDVIGEICRSKYRPAMMLIEIHLSPDMNCQDYVMAQAWRSTLSAGGYELANWRRNPSCPNCIETTYVRRDENERRAVSNECHLRFHIMNEGLGGSLSQIMMGMVFAAEMKMTFCLSNALIDPQLEHMNQYNWIHTYFFMRRCREYVRAECDVDMSWQDSFWSQKSVSSRLRSSYPQMLVDSAFAIQKSAYNKRYTWCVHVRTGDLTNIPDVVWNDKDLIVFGWDGHVELDFCNERNRCTMVRDQGVESDFVNIATCKHSIISDSSFAVTAGLLGGRTEKPDGRGRTKEFYY